MGQKKCEVNNEIRNLIITHYKDKKTQREIVSIMKVSKPIVHGIITLKKNQICGKKEQNKASAHTRRGRRMLDFKRNKENRYCRSK